MKNREKIFNYLAIYLIILLAFSYFFLFIKHQVGNDSTISEWLINYEGGFTKRGIIGQIAIIFSRLFETNLRLIILLLQSFSVTIYFFLLFNLLKKLNYDRVIFLSIFTPIFILYPIAEIEVLARKEIIVFSFFLTYFLIPTDSKMKIFSLSIFLFFAILVWEPIIFFFPLIFLFEIIEKNIEELDFNFVKIILAFLPSLIIAFIMIIDPLTDIEFEKMKFILKNEFDQKCYMSCALLKSKSSIIQQFQGNFGKYSLEVFVRYFLIILIGFYPLFVLINNSYFKNNRLFLIKKFKKPSYIFYFTLVPVILLFAMGYDWGRWVNVSYVILALIYFQLLQKNLFILNLEKLRKNFLYKIKKKIFIFFFILYCFGWNPKTVITGDVASFPGYRIPYKVFKLLN